MGRATLEETCSWIGKMVISVVGLTLTSAVIDRGIETTRKAVEFYKVNKLKKELEREQEEKEV